MAARPSEALLPGHRADSTPAALLAGWMLLAALALILLALLPEEDVPTAGAALLTIGVIGLWRWSWAGVHFIRAMIYRRRVFPRLRAQAEGAPLPPALYVVVTSYRISPEMNAAVYGRLLDEARQLRIPCCVVACITDMADAEVLRLVFDQRRATLAEGSALYLLPQAGTGKRGALVDAINLIQGLGASPHAQMLLMDGDTLIEPGQMERTCRFLSAFPDVGAVTTDNLPLVRGPAPVREWYRLRMSQRDQGMCSMALSRRLLVLTGRFSLFRMEAVASPSFALAVGNDGIRHWRLGFIRMVTGDDKSTWFALLKTPWRMLYIPDVAVVCAEELPAGGWFKASTALMLRWYGNTTRNNGRALALGPRRLGWFFWFCLLDQRISPWTSLSGPAVMVAAAILHGYGFLILYILWVLITRSLMTLLNWLGTGRFHPIFPLLLYYNQIVGSLVKIFVLHHPDRQRWNRQGLAASGSQGLAARLSGGFFALSLSGFLLLVLTLAYRLDPQIEHGAPIGLPAVLDVRPRPEHYLRMPCAPDRLAPCTVVTPPAPPTGLTAPGPRPRA
jgi:mannuronan synthase